MDYERRLVMDVSYSNVVAQMRLELAEQGLGVLTENRLSWTTCQVPGEVTRQIALRLGPGSRQEGRRLTGDDRAGGASADRPGGRMGGTLLGADRGKVVGIAGDLGIGPVVVGNVPCTVGNARDERAALGRWSRRR